MKALLTSGLFYAWWYPSRWLGWGRWPRYSRFGSLARHLRFVERNSRKLARQVFHGMVVYQGKLQNKQAFLFRLVDVANELFAMSASVTRAHALAENGHESASEIVQLTDAFCKNSRRTVRQLFHDLWRNDDTTKYRTALGVLDGKYRWLEEELIQVELEGSLGLSSIPETEPEESAAPHVAAS